MLAVVPLPVQAREQLVPELIAEQCPLDLGSKSSDSDKLTLLPIQLSFVIALHMINEHLPLLLQTLFLALSHSLQCVCEAISYNYDVPYPLFHNYMNFCDG